MIHIGKANVDNNIYPINDYLNVINGGFEWYDIVKNGNNPISVNQYSRFEKYTTDASYTIPNEDTGNLVYPATTTPTYLNSEGVYEPSARTFAWGAGGVPSQSAGDWYLYCSGAEDTDATSKGKGNYNFSKTETPVWSDLKGGWYSASGYRVLARFNSSAGNAVSEVMRYVPGLLPIGYIQTSGLYLSTNALVLAQLLCDLGGGRGVEYKEDVTVCADVTALTASTWYCVLVNVATGDLTYTTIAAQTSWTGVSTNQLNAATHYDKTRKYVYVNNATTYYRVLGIFKINSGATGLSYLFNIFNFPKSFCDSSSNANLTVNNASETTIDYEDINIDINSEITTGGSWVFTAKKTGIYNIVATYYWNNSAGFTTNEQMYIKIVKNGVANEIIDNIYLNDPPIANIYIFLRGVINIDIKKGDTINICAYQNSGGNINNTNVATAVYFKLHEY